MYDGEEEIYMELMEKSKQLETKNLELQDKVNQAKEKLKNAKQRGEEMKTAQNNISNNFTEANDLVLDEDY